jgi:DNA ligase-1
MLEPTFFCKYMLVDESFEIDQFTIKRLKDHYSCTCQEWNNMGKPIVVRTCSHLKRKFGDLVEQSRIADAAAGFCQQVVVKEKKTKHPEPMLLLPQKWIDHNVTGYHMTEKLDGVRCYYDNKLKCLISRLGNEFPCPEWFIKGLPTHMSLDGELFIARGLFQQTLEILKSSDNWDQLKFHIFDSPSVAEPFEQRFAKIKEFFEANPSAHVELVVGEICKGKDHVYETLKRVESLGGEGVMLRKPKSLYVGKRSATLLKVKSFYDAEAVVSEHIPGKGKYTGMLGALQCTMECGLSFKLGTGYTDKDRVKPPPIGSIVTYRFQELTPDKLPKFPAFVCVRLDADKPRDAVIITKVKGGEDD